MGSAEFSEWLAYASAEPLGGDRDDFNAAQICSLIANVNRDASKQAKPFTALDFMPPWWGGREEEPKMSGEDTLAFMREHLPLMKSKEGTPSQPSQN